MTPKTRRIVQAILYEAFAAGFVGPGLALAFDKPPTSALTLSLIMCTFALTWSYIFNSLFERWESRQTVKGRSLLRRIAHASGFEGGLVVMLVPIIAWWLDISLAAAFVADLGVLIFFFIYAFVFNWAFDRVFGLPASASHGAGVQV
ncbi:MAG: PACE efflux transporter [Pseudomonadota bacterium]